MLSEDSYVKSPMFPSCQFDVEEGKRAILLWLHGELDGGVYIIEMVEQGLHSRHLSALCSMCHPHTT